MARRIHVGQVRAGVLVPLDRAEAHHARDVLRLPDGAEVEVFDDAGTVGTAVLVFDGNTASVRVEDVEPAGADLHTPRLRLAAAVPKGDRADWMVEKLSELGVDEFIPLAAARSVVLPEGKGKRDRWHRIATEAAKQSRRAGVMRITELTDVGDALRAATRDSAGAPGCAWFLSTEAPDATPVNDALARLAPGAALTAFVGPEGGWTPQEQERFLAAGAVPVRLTSTVLRIETAAVTTAAVVKCLRPSPPLDARHPPDDHPADPTGDAP